MENNIKERMLIEELADKIDVVQKIQEIAEISKVKYIYLARTDFEDMPRFEKHKYHICVSTFDGDYKIYFSNYSVARLLAEQISLPTPAPLLDFVE